MATRMSCLELSFIVMILHQTPVAFGLTPGEVEIEGSLKSLVS